MGDLTFYEYEELLNQENELQHHGIKRQRWGVRRFQNPDGSLTPAGRERYRKNKDGVDDISNETNAGVSEKVQAKRTYKDLSNQELRDVTERTRLENEYVRQKYEQLKLSQGPQIQKGESWLRKVANVSSDVTKILANANAVAKIFGFDLASTIRKKAAESGSKTDEIKIDPETIKRFKESLKRDIGKEVGKGSKK